MTSADSTGSMSLTLPEKILILKQAETIGVGTYMEHARNYLNAKVQSYSFTGRHRIKRHAVQWGLELKTERIKDKLREWEMRDSAGIHCHRCRTAQS